MLIKLLRNLFSESEAPKTKNKNQTNITDGHTFILTRAALSANVRAVRLRCQGGDRWVKFHEESLDFHPRFFPVFEEKREN